MLHETKKKKKLKEKKPAQNKKDKYYCVENEHLGQHAKKSLRPNNDRTKITPSI